VVTLLRHLGVGLALGVLTGVEARGFMRLLSEEPEFTWSGTAVVVGAFAVAGAALALTHDLKQRHRSTWWKLLALPAVVLGLGQGVVLLPGILAVSLVLSRRRWIRIVGLLILVAYIVLMPAVLGTSGELLTVRFGLGLVGLVLCCAAVATGARAALTGWWSAAARHAERDRGQGADNGRDRGSAEDPLDLHDRGVEQRLPVGLVGQGSDGGVVLVQADRGEQGESDDHADHPGDDDEGARRAVRIIG
jgi:uncharacterized membrane protein YhaH (DUF805 family)